jgi:hypothetical protein
LLYRYAERIDAGDLEGLAGLFSEAEFLDAMGRVVATGKAELFALFKAAVKIDPNSGTPGTKHVTSNVIIEVDEVACSAAARSYFTVFQAVQGSPLQAIIAGRYNDQFLRVNNVWQFQKRCVITELYGDVSDHLHYDPRVITA